MLPAQTDRVIFYGESFNITPVSGGGVTYEATLGSGERLSLYDLRFNGRTGKMDASIFAFSPKTRQLVTTLTVNVQAVDSDDNRSDIQSFELVLATAGGYDLDIPIEQVSSSPTQAVFRIALDPSICSRAYETISISIDRVAAGATSGCGASSGTGWDVSYDTENNFLQVEVSGTSLIGKQVVGNFNRSNAIVASFTYNIPDSNPLSFPAAALTVSIDENMGSSRVAVHTPLATVRVANSDSNLTPEYELEYKGIGLDEGSFCITGELISCGTEDAGIVKVIKGALLDHERKDSYTVTVHAFVDNGYRVSRAVVINVNDVAETAPVFSPDGARVSIDLSVLLPVGADVVTLTATSASAVTWKIEDHDDEGDRRLIAYGIKSGRAAAANTYLATVFIKRKQDIHQLHLFPPEYIEVSAANSGSDTGKAEKLIFLNAFIPASFNDVERNLSDRVFMAGANYTIFLEQALERKIGQKELKSFTRYSMSLADGSSLPGWLSYAYNAERLLPSLVATNAPAGSYNIRLNALNDDDTVAVYEDFTIQVVANAGAGVLSLDAPAGPLAAPFVTTVIISGDLTPTSLLPLVVRGRNSLVVVSNTGRSGFTFEQKYAFPANVAVGDRSVVVSVVGRLPGTHSDEVVLGLDDLDLTNVPVNYFGAASQTVVLSWTIPNYAPSFSGASVDVMESRGREMFLPTDALPIAAFAGAEDANGEELTYTVLGSLGEKFSIRHQIELGENLDVGKRIDALSRQVGIFAAEPLNINYEELLEAGSTHYVLDVMVEDAGGLSAQSKVTINVLDRAVERIGVGDARNALSIDASFATTAVRKPRIALGLSWDNSPYHALYAPFDRGDIVLGWVNVTSSVAGSITLAHDVNSAVISALTPGTDYRVSLTWFNADGLADYSHEFTASTAANNIPALARTAVTVMVTENVALPAGRVLFDLSSITSDADNDQLRFVALTGSGRELSLDTQSGQVSLLRELVPDAEGPGDGAIQFPFSVVDNYGGEVVGSFNLVVEGVNEPPVFTDPESILVFTHETGGSKVLDQAQDPETDALVHSVDTSTLPNGITYTAASRTLGVASTTDAGVYSISYKAQESSTSEQLEVMKTYKVIVVADPTALPTFTALTSPFEFPENRGSEQTAAGVAVATVVINNPTSFTAGDLSYSLVGSESEIGPFEIGAANGI
ncbi:MAG: hypothetical protein OXC81_01785, partial [Betaproteobacteria bacterium]|nr:hypothetical protein [Betaproteobacteria bacterium]